MKANALKKVAETTESTGRSVYCTLYEYAYFCESRTIEGVVMCVGPRRNCDVALC